MLTMEAAAPTAVSLHEANCGSSRGRAINSITDHTCKIFYMAFDTSKDKAFFFFKIEFEIT